MHPRRRLLRKRHGAYARARFNLVAPLAGVRASATATRAPDTAAQLDIFGEGGPVSGAVAPLIGQENHDLRGRDVTSAIDGSTPTTVPTPGTRASTTATRTTGTPAITTGRVPSADGTGAGFSFADLLAAYIDCRRTKRNTGSALAFEQDLERNLAELYDELITGTYRPGPTICFVINRPKKREVWAAGFRDRVVHHLLYRHIGPLFEASFIADTCACIPGRGTLYAAERLEAKVRSQTHNWSRPGYYLKCDLANFFVSIDKRILRGLLADRINEPWWLNLAERILFHDPRPGVDLRGTVAQLEQIPPHKSLFTQPAHLGLPIGNLSSQFFANIYLDHLDQFVKHFLRARHYIRYVDDFVLLHRDPGQLNAWRADIEAFVERELRLKLNPAKTILQPIARGIDFAGQLIKPWRRIIRRRTVNEALSRIRQLDPDEVFESANSYFGLLRQATHSHADRARLARLVRQRGLSVNHQLTKCYRRAS